MILERILESPERLNKTDWWSGASNSVAVVWGPVIFTFSKFPGNTDDVGLGMKWKKRHYQQRYADKLDNLGEMNIFLKMHNEPRLNHKKNRNLNKFIRSLNQQLKA